MAQQLRAFAVLTVNLGLVPSTHVATQPSETPVPVHLTFVGTPHTWYKMWQATRKTANINLWSPQTQAPQTHAQDQLQSNPHTKKPNQTSKGRVDRRDSGWGDGNICPQKGKAMLIFLAIPRLQK